MLDTGFWMLDSGYLILNSGYLILDTGCWILDVFEFFDSVHLDNQHQVSSILHLLGEINRIQAI